MHLIEDDLVGVADAPEASEKCQRSNDGQRNLVVACRLSAGTLSTSLGQLIELDVGSEGFLGALFGQRTSLSQAALRRRAARHVEGRPESRAATVKRKRLVTGLMEVLMMGKEQKKRTQLSGRIIGRKRDDTTDCTTVAATSYKPDSGTQKNVRPTSGLASSV